MSASVVDHPLVHHNLARLRSKATGHFEFRHLVRQLTYFLACEATRDIPTVDKPIETPLKSMTGKQLAVSIGLVPILRAGLGMLEPLLELIPSAEVWHLGLYRNEETAEPVEYYNNLPPGRPTDWGLILDPMLATGGSAGATCQTLIDWGVKKIKLLSLIAAPEGIDQLKREFPDLEIFVCAVDEHLDERKFIVPGLGDAGDRIFNTEIN